MQRSLAMTILLAVTCLSPVLAVRAQQPPPSATASQPAAKTVERSATAARSTDAIERIKEEGLKRSQVMATLSYLTDVIGPRLTGSPNLKRANEWTRDKLAAWGLVNARLEGWGPFGRGWSLNRFSAQVVAPQCIPLIGFPKAWSPGLDGKLEARVVYFDAKSEAEFVKFKGKLKGAIVLTGRARELAARWEPLATRKTDSELLALANAAEASTRDSARRTVQAQENARETSAGSGASAASRATSSTDGSAQPPRRRGFRLTPEQLARMELDRKKLMFLSEEGAALLFDPSDLGDGGTFFVTAASVPGAPLRIPGQSAKRISAYDKDAPKNVPQVVLSKEHYNRLVRMYEANERLKVAVELSVQFHDGDLMAYNTIAEIPGTDLKDELVMLGGHMDSWHSGTGATDNGAGISVAMEVVRILQALELKPRRTIRIALWTGEEEGLLGSRAFVKQHFGRSPPDPYQRQATAATSASSDGSGNGSSTSTKPSAESAPNSEYTNFSGYFNLDNGTGKIRGVYLQGNEAVRPIFRRWLQPFRDMGASTLTIADTGGTDHLSFDGIGLPGFQFIQDEIEYETRTHHSNQDVFDRIQGADLKQAAVIMASFVYNAAMMDDKLPRKPAKTPESRTTSSPVRAAAAP